MTVAVLDFTATRRICNVTGDEYCDACADGAFVVAALETRPITRAGKGGSVAIVGEYQEETYGPCPRCERGYRLEFGLGRNADGSEYTNPKGGPWGKDGFWRGRDVPAELRP